MYDTPHAVTDQSKLAELAASMQEHGWQGAPLVLLDEDQLITGTHRYTAWTRVLDRPANEIPTIGLDEIFARHGLDLAALCAEYVENFQDVAYLLQMLPNATREAYGLDLD